MGLPLARTKVRGRVAVLLAATLALTGLAIARSRSVEAHEVIRPYPVTCSMVGWAPVFTTTHTPEAGTTPGGTMTLHVKMATPGSGHAMPTGMVEFVLPKPAEVERIESVTFRQNGNFSGMLHGTDAAGNMQFMFMGNAQSNAVQLSDFDITAVTKADATGKVSWIGPSEIKLDGGNTDTCRPTGGPVEFAPTTILIDDPSCPTTTMGHSHGHDDHGDHSHGAPDPCPTTTTATTATTTTTRATTTTTRPTTTTTRATTTTTRATTTTSTTVTTRPTTTTTRATTTTVHNTTTTTEPSGGLLGLIRRVLCFLFRFLCN